MTQGVYELLLKHGLHYKPTEEQVNDILAGATSQGASDADVELSKQSVHACVRARAREPPLCAKCAHAGGCLHHRW